MNLKKLYNSLLLATPNFDNKQTIIPKYSLEDLEVKLKQAVDEEEYEKAAKIRDKIKELES